MNNKSYKNRKIGGHPRHNLQARVERLEERCVAGSFADVAAGAALFLPLTHEFGQSPVERSAERHADDDLDERARTHDHRRDSLIKTNGRKNSQIRRITQPARADDPFRISQPDSASASLRQPRQILDVEALLSLRQVEANSQKRINELASMVATKIDQSGGGSNSNPAPVSNATQQQNAPMLQRWSATSSRVIPEIVSGAEGETDSTTPRIDLEIYFPAVIYPWEPMVLDALEMSLGSQTFQNIDNDDHDTHFDKDDNDGVIDKNDADGVNPGDDELVKIRIKVDPAGLLVGSVTLNTNNSDLLYFDKNDRTSPITAPSFSVPSGFPERDGVWYVHTLWVEDPVADSVQRATTITATYMRSGMTNLQDQVALGAFPFCRALNER